MLVKLLLSGALPGGHLAQLGVAAVLLAGRPARLRDAGPVRPGHHLGRSRVTLAEISSVVFNLQTQESHYWIMQNFVHCILLDVRRSADKPCEAWQQQPGVLDPSGAAREGTQMIRQFAAVQFEVK